jgi:hypothetical protein
LIAIGHDADIFKGPSGGQSGRDCLTFKNDVESTTVVTSPQLFRH